MKTIKEAGTETTGGELSREQVREFLSKRRGASQVLADRLGITRTTVITVLQGQRTSSNVLDAARAYVRELVVEDSKILEG